MGLPDALGRWVLDRILDNPKVDLVTEVHKAALAGYVRSVDLFASPARPRPFPPLAPLAGSFVNPGIGKAVVIQEGDALVMAMEATGAKLALTPWDGDIFTASIVPAGPFKAISEDLGPLPTAFVQWQIGKDGKLGVLRLSFDEDSSTISRANSGFGVFADCRRRRARPVSPAALFSGVPDCCRVPYSGGIDQGDGRWAWRSPRSDGCWQKMSLVLCSKAIIRIWRNCRTHSWWISDASCALAAIEPAI